MIAPAFILTWLILGADSAQINFSRDILPILSDNCYSCHGPDEKARKAKLRLDTQEGALGKSKSPGSHIIKPKDTAKSELFQRLVTTDEKELMPPPSSARKLNKNQIDLLKAWIDQGANWGKHWAFEAPIRPSVPFSTGESRIANPIDSFILEKLKAEGLKQAAVAPRETLARRLFLDLTGLPPNLAQVESFINDNSPSAYAKLVDSLLASPYYGERMVWDWLDASRYADSNGYQGDNERTMWPWRDWVASAFNNNLSFKDFTTWQLAGDLLPNPSFEQRLATGFNRNYMINGEGGRIAAENRIDYVMDMSETMGTIWLGLTFNCCRCHDHKYDALSQKDYYQLFSFFNNTPVDGGGGNPQTPPVVEFLSPEQLLKKKQFDSSVGNLQSKVEELENKIFPRDKGKKASESDDAAAFSKDSKDILSKPAGSRGKAQLQQLAKVVEKAKPELFQILNTLVKAIDERDNFTKSMPRVMVMEELPKPRDTFILNIGNYEKPLAKVGIAVPAVLPQIRKADSINRLDLAGWLFAKENPLTSRVIVNRIWQQFFGTGIVKTSEDFGVQGEKPSHPDLLDWLAVEFQESNWDIKHLIKLIMLSETYQQSSRLDSETKEKDSANKFLSHGPRYRRPAWMIRDQALAASGLLIPQIGGPPTRPYQPQGIWEDATFGNKKYVQDQGENLYKRSVYTFWRRIIGPTMFFDTPARQYCNVKLSRTNTPLHALATLNDTTYVEASRVLAQRELLASASKDDLVIENIFRAILARKPSPEEADILSAAVKRYLSAFEKDVEAAKKFIAVGKMPANKDIDSRRLAAFGTLALSLFNLDEALNKE